jgi:charged multivesicular body protein 3
MEEMMEETLDSVDDDELEQEADEEVDKVLFDLTDGKLGQAGRVGGELPVRLRAVTSLRPIIQAAGIARGTNDAGATRRGGDRGRDAAYAEGDGGSPQLIAPKRTTVYEKSSCLLPYLFTYTIPSTTCNLHTWLISHHH